MSRPAFVAHVGLPKTGTSTLQREVFARHSGLFAITTNSQGKGKELCENLHLLNDASDDDVTRIARGFPSALAAANSESLPVIMSKESFTFPRKTDWRTAPQKLQKAIGEARIVIVVREQLSWLESYYFHEQRRNAAAGRIVLPQPYVLKEIDRGVNGAFSVMGFDDLARAWEDVFGRENVTVIPFEWMRTNPQSLFAPFANGLGVDGGTLVDLLATAERRNERFSVDQFYAGLHNTHMRKRNPLGFKLAQMAGFSLANSGAFNPASVKFDFAPLIDETVKAVWREQNQSLAKRHGLDLASLGYMV